METKKEITTESVMLRTMSFMEQQLTDSLSRIEELETEIRSLRKTQTTLQMMAENVDDLLAVIDRDGKRAWNNPAYLRVLGYSPDEIEGTVSFEEIHEEDKAKVGEAFQKAMHQGITSSLEYRMRHKNGSWITLESKARIVRDSNEVPQYLVLVARDVTDRQQVEEEKAKGSRVEAMALVAEGLAQEYTDIVTGILHQLSLAKQNAPVGSVFYNKVLDAEEVAARAELVTRRISEMARHEDMDKKPVALQPILQELGADLTRNTVCRCDFVIAGDLPAVQAHDPSLRRLVSNLITNAVESMTSRGVIRISADKLDISARTALRPAGLPPGTYIRLQIRDQGKGIDDEIKAKLFEPYFTTKSGHTGLGLTTALSIAKNHGGTIVVQSTLNVGTTVVCYLLASDQGAIEQARPTGKTGQLPQPVSATPGRILIMDDEKIVTDFLNLSLTRLGYEVVTTADGAQAIAAYLKARSSGKPFDVVLMDIVVPVGVGGLDALQTLNQFNPNLVSILASGKMDEIDWNNPTHYGATQLLKKPFSIPILNDLLTRLVEYARQRTKG